jgi:hypothetical protein
MNLPNHPNRNLPSTSKLAIWFLLLTILGIWPALTNGQPFYYIDTTAYVRGADPAISKVFGARFSTAWAKDPRRMIEPQNNAQSAELAADQTSSRHVVLAGRSIIYGGLLYLGAILGGMWFSIICQSPIGTYLSYVEGVARELARSLNGRKVVVEKSTVPVRTCEALQRSMVLNGADPNSFTIASNPEFLREGTAVSDFLFPDREPSRLH